LKKDALYIEPKRLVPGLFIDLELNWSEHPFLFNKFRIKNTYEIQKIVQILGNKRVKIITPKSKASALKSLLDNPIQSSTPATPEPEPEPEPDETHDSLWHSKKSSLEQAEEYRKEHRKNTQHYKETQKRIARLARSFKMSPINAIHDVEDIIQDLTNMLTDQKSIIVSMVSLTEGDFSIHHHALNVTVLSLVLGRSLELSAKELHHLGIGCVLHDVGKLILPQSIVLKKTPLTENESELLKTHISRGVKLVSQTPDFPSEALEIIAHHHVYMDGSGFPATTSSADISKLTRIAQVANHYDGMCNPLNPKDGLSPKTAMAKLFSDYDGRLDNYLIHQFVRHFGVYPPGTVVSLSDGSIALIIAVNNDNLLAPQVVIYNPDIPANQALMLTLSDHPELTINRTLNRGEYPESVQQYLGIGDHIGYFVAPAK
jgi:HD-GYP domain-containing protein (c-di-GMP phosphodiesterase class II)